MTSELGRVPLLVHGLRVFAGPRSVWADGPATARTEATPYWSYRRWPQQLIGVVVTDGVVVSRWSDGLVAAVETRTGRAVWRSLTTPSQPGPSDRTGARLVYDVDGLATAPGVVIVDGMALDAATGRTLWRTTGCPDAGFTAHAYYVQPCDGLRVRDARTGVVRTTGTAVGRVQPVGCAVGHSSCGGFRDRRGAWVVTPDGAIVRVPALDPTGARLAGDIVVAPSGSDQVTATSVRAGRPLWTHGGTLVATTDQYLHLLVRDRLVTLDRRSGRELVRTPVNRWPVAGVSGLWRAGHGYAVEDLLVVEREDGRGSPYGARPVLVLSR